MKKITLLFSFLICLLSQTMVMAQSDAAENPKPFGASKFLLAGHTQLSAVYDTSGSSMGDAGFSAIFLYKLSDRLFMESELEVGTGGGSVEVGLEHAKLVWMFSDNMAFYAGRWVPKFGMYRGRIGESFINKFATDPAGFGDGGIGAMEETGFGFTGGLPMGPCKLNYDVWLTNGPQLLADPANIGSAGQFDYEAYTENNKDKTYGGRIGWLPLSNSSLEIGISAEHAGNTLDQASTYAFGKKVGVDMGALDINFYHPIDFIKSTLRLSGEYKMQKVANFDYSLMGDSIQTEDATGAYYNVALPSFNNSSNTWYGTFSLRPSAMKSKVLRNFEVAYRFSKFTPPEHAPWGSRPITRKTYAIDYWLKWNCVAKLCYEQESRTNSKVYVQMVYGF